MKKSLKIISIILLAVLCLTLASCGKKKAEPEVTTVKVTVPEGYTVIQIAELLEKKKVCKKDDFLALCNKVPEKYSSLFSGVSAEGKLFLMEGYLFPDTYEFFMGESPENALSRFLENTEAKFGKDTTYEDIVLASIIQAECSDPNEMPKVSAVFHNRLRRPDMFPYIGSDVTRQYIEKNKSYIEEKGLDYSLLFRNYCTNDNYSGKIKGLPIGPVCNPGMEAINAAKHPADNDALYFFTAPDGSFHYNHSNSDHSSEYQKLHGKA